jgi:hypothetical protein
MNKRNGIFHTLKTSVGVLGVLGIIGVMSYMYGQSVQAASVACQRQAIDYGSQTGGYPITLPENEMLNARASGTAGLENSTDVTVERSYTLAAGTLQSNANTKVNGEAIGLGLNYGSVTQESPTGGLTATVEFSSSPVRGLRFNVQDVEKRVTGEAEVAQVLVYEAGSASPISDLSPYHTTDEVIFNGSNSYEGNTSTAQNSSIIQGNIAFNFADKVIDKVSVIYTYKDTGDSSAGGGILLNNISFDGPCIGLAVNAIPEGDTVKLDYTIENTGGLPLTAISLPENLDAIFGVGNYTIVSNPSRISGEPTVIANDGFAGGGVGDILKPASALALDKSSVVRLVVKIKNPAVGGDGKGNYSSTEQVTARPLAATAFTVSDDSVSGVKTDVNGNGDAADDTSPWKVALSSVATVPGTPKTGDIATISRPLQVAGFSTVALAPLVYLNRARLLARFKR